MKTKFLIFVLALFSYTFVNAQNSHLALNEKARVYTDQMVSELDLTDNQQELIHRQNITWLEQEARYERLEERTDQHKGYMENSRQDYIKNVTDLLTDDQRVAFKTWLKKSKLLKY